MRSFINSKILGLGLVLVAVATAVAADLRTWSDSTGKFKIQARFVAIDKGKVTLAQEDGSEIEIELKRLSAGDQKYVTDLGKADANPFKPARDAPFQPKPKTSAKGNASAKKVKERGVATESKLVVPDWSGADEVDPNPTQGEWRFPVPPATRDVPKLAVRPIALPPKRNFFEGIKGLVVNEASRAVVGYSLDEPKPAGSTRLVLCDLENGRMLGSATMAGKLIPLDLHDNGTQVLMRRDEWGDDNQDRLELWSLSGSTITKGIQWIPYDDRKGGERAVRWAAFVDERRVATVSGSGKLAVWDLESARPLYHFQIQGACIPGLSPDRKYLAFTTGKEVGVLDVEQGEVIARQPTPNNTPWPVLSFSPGGKRLACLAFDRAFVWDFATGRLEREISFHGLNVNSKAIWPTDDHLLLGNRTLIDLASQVRLWDYQGHEQVQSLGGLCWFAVVQGDRPGALVPARVPQPAVEEALKRALADPGFFVLKPGTTVRINVDGLADPAGREKARAALAARLQKNGVQNGPAGTIELVATTEIGQEREIAYHFFGGGIKTFKIREHIARVRFLYQGQKVWEASAVNIPFMVRLKQGETMEQHIRDSERPNYAYFTGVELPKLLTRPTNGSGTLGSSRVTVSGLR